MSDFSQSSVAFRGSKVFFFLSIPGESVTLDKQIANRKKATNKTGNVYFVKLQRIKI